MAKKFNQADVKAGSFFQCKVKYERVTENGSCQKVNEPYIVKACSFTEAEKEINEYIQPFTSGEYLISDIQRCKFSEIIENKNGQFYYKCTVNIIVPNEKSGKEKKVKQLVLVQSNSIKEVCECVEVSLKDTIGDSTIAKVEETAIMDVCIND